MLVCGHLHNMRLWINLFASFLLVLLLITPEIKFAELRTHSSHCYGHATLLYMGCSAYIKNSVSVMKWLNSTTYYFYYLLETKCLPTELCLPFSYFQFNLPKHVIQFQFQHPIVILLHSFSNCVTCLYQGDKQRPHLLSSHPLYYIFWPCYFIYWQNYQIESVELYQFVSKSSLPIASQLCMYMYLNVCTCIWQVDITNAW